MRVRSCHGEFCAKYLDLCWTTGKFRVWKSPPWWHTSVSTAVDSNGLSDFLQKRFHITFLHRVLCRHRFGLKQSHMLSVGSFQTYFPLPLIFQDTFLPSRCWSSVSFSACLTLALDTWGLFSFSAVLTEQHYFLPSSYFLLQLHISKCFTKEIKILSPILQMPAAAAVVWLAPDCLISVAEGWIET